ncbi:MAG TPA: hypothetical protein VL025_12575 [Thermoanaerobaculia bacterium]|nr:hypothetical protein [Thermoanaerobaculia bacterium]
MAQITDIAAITDIADAPARPGTPEMHAFQRKTEIGIDSPP